MHHLKDPEVGRQEEEQTGDLWMCLLLVLILILLIQGSVCEIFKE